MQQCSQQAQLQELQRIEESLPFTFESERLADTVPELLVRGLRRRYACWRGQVSESAELRTSPRFRMTEHVDPAGAEEGAYNLRS